MLNRKATIAILTLRPFGPNAKVKLDLFNYATKADFKNTTGIATLKFD